MKQLEYSHIASGITEWHRHFENNLIVSYKVKHTLKVWPIIGVPGWLSQLNVRLLVLAWVMISWFVESSPVSGSALEVRGLFRILSLPFSLPLPHMHTSSLFLSKNKTKQNKTNDLKYDPAIPFLNIPQEKQNHKHMSTQRPVH